MPGLAARCAAWCSIVLECFRAQGPGSGYRRPLRARRADLHRLQALDGVPVFGANDRSGAPYILEHFPPWAGTIAPERFEIVCNRCCRPVAEAGTGSHVPQAWSGPFGRHADACAALTEHRARSHAHQP